MTKVFFDVCVTLDGFMAPPNPDPEDELLNAKWMKEWMKVVGWVFPLRFFRENLHLGPGGETGQEDRLVEEAFHRTGTTIMGKNMFRAGEKGWPEDAPFHTPVFVLTHEPRKPWKRPGGTTFHFVNDGPRAALRQAREAAQGKDIRIGGGATTIRQFLDAGLVDEFTLHVSPMLLGDGIPLFAGVDGSRASFHPMRALHAPHVTHVTYQVRPSREAKPWVFFN